MTATNQSTQAYSIINTSRDGRGASEAPHGTSLDRHETNHSVFHNASFLPLSLLSFFLLFASPSLIVVPLSPDKRSFAFFSLPFHLFRHERRQFPGGCTSYYHRQRRCPRASRCTRTSQSACPDYRPRSKGEGLRRTPDAASHIHGASGEFTRLAVPSPPKGLERVGAVFCMWTPRGRSGQCRTNIYST